MTITFTKCFILMTVVATPTYAYSQSALQHVTNNAAL